jgi:hypothetical protein
LHQYIQKCANFCKAEVSKLPGVTKRPTFGGMTSFSSPRYSGLFFVIARPQAVAIHAWTATLRSQ